MDPLIRQAALKLKLHCGGSARALTKLDSSDCMDQDNPQVVLKHLKVQRVVSLISPMQLYNDATAIIVDPTRKTTRSFVLMGPLERLSSARFSRPLDLSQSIYVVIPHIISLIAITFICFGVSYAVFMRQEIRSV
jgi:ABC-2 type transport system permease protein